MFRLNSEQGVRKHKSSALPPHQTARCGRYEDYRLLKRDAVQFCRMLPTFRKNLSPPAGEESKR